MDIGHWIIPLTVAVAASITHIIKQGLHIWRHGTFSWYVMFLQTGGMPSGHSASVTSLVVSIFFYQGLGPLFWACCVFALVVMRDAFGVRKSASDNATLLNAITGRLKYRKRVKVVLGHTPLQVGVGAFIGLVVGLIIGLL